MIIIYDLTIHFSYQRILFFSLISLKILCIYIFIYMYIYYIYFYCIVNQILKRRFEVNFALNSI